MPHTHYIAPSQERYNSLKAKHHTLEKEIDVLQQCPSSDDILKALKKEKLRVKEEMEGLRSVA